MTDAELTDMIRRMTLGSSPEGLSTTIIAQAKTEAINLLAHLLVASSPESFEKKVSLAPKHTNTHIFTMPSDNLGIKRVWDYDGDAGDISDADDNGSGLIRLTHDLTLTDEDIVSIHDIVGTTEANGMWQIDYKTSTTCDLVGSTYANAYSSGGRIFIEQEDTYKYPIDRLGSKFQGADDETKYFYKEDDIIIDNPDFENDLIVLYRYLPSTLAEIPSRMHFGIYAFASLMLISLPTNPKDPKYPTLQKNLTFCKGLWDTVQGMASSYRPVLEQNNISDRSEIKRWL